MELLFRRERTSKQQQSDSNWLLTDRLYRERSAGSGSAQPKEKRPTWGRMIFSDREKGSDEGNERASNMIRWLATEMGGKGERKRETDVLLCERRSQ